MQSGNVRYSKTPEAISEQEQENQIILPCQAQATSDIVLQAHLVGAEDIQVKKLPCRVVRKRLLAPDVMELGLKLPVTERLQFLAGQYIDILLQDGRRRSFSLANAPHEDELLLLHIRHIEGGEFTDFVFKELEEKAILRIEGPLGTFYLREDSPRPLIFMAGGTGFGPIKSIVEHAFAEGITRPMHLYWGARTRQDLYLHDMAEEWLKTHTHFRYTPVLSKPHPDDHWEGRTGFVHQAVCDDFDDLNGFDVYASGPPAMVDAAKTAFAEKGLDLSHYFSDAFEFQAPKN
jgi:CDP-4-dehydro-6-deoxyglucose reductase